MPRDYHKECPECLAKDLDLRSLLVERDEARAHAVRWEHEAHQLRKEVQRLRMECSTEGITR